MQPLKALLAQEIGKTDRYRLTDLEMNDDISNMDKIEKIILSRKYRVYENVTQVTTYYENHAKEYDMLYVFYHAGTCHVFTLPKTIDKVSI